MRRTTLLMAWTLGTFVLSAVLPAVLAARAWGADHYVDPVEGAPSGDGSPAHPWRTLQEVVDAGLVESRGWASLPPGASTALVPKNAGAPIKAGDTIYLRSGYHGELMLSGHYNAAQITIAAEPGHSPRFKSVLVRSSSNWRLSGLHVSPAYAPAYERKTLVSVASHGHSGPAHDIVVEHCVLASVDDSSGWSAADWNARACNGISASGSEITIRHNNLKNVNFGISVTATASLVEYNLVENFSGDGMRGLGDHTTFQYNTVKNCYNVNDNHDDGFQSWSVGDDGVGTGEVVGIVLRGNRIINYEDPLQPHRGPLQGIGCFDGMFVDWVVENNVVIADHWHGITLLGANNARIVNNTVLDPNNDKPGPVWIRVGHHKNGTESQGCIVRNNLAQSFNSDTPGVQEDHNVEYTDPSALFVDPTNYDLHLLPSATDAIDTGSLALAPTNDADRIPRPQGTSVDVGAYEWTDKPPQFFDAGTSGDGASIDGGTTADGSNPSGDSGALTDGAIPGDGNPESPSDGCSCRSVEAGHNPLTLMLLALTVFVLASRRRHRHHTGR